LSTRRPESHGHRGARGLAPENTLAGIEAALGIGVDALELDVAVSRDGVVVLHHDQLLNPDTTRDAAGRWIDCAAPPAVHALSYAELRVLDVGAIRPGSEYARRFPHQRPLDGARIPTLAEAATLAREAGGARVRLNVEIKSDPQAPERAPAPGAFADLVLGVLRETAMARGATVQSFDWRVIGHLRHTAPEVLACCLSSRRPHWDTVGGRDGAASPWTAGHRLEDHGGSVPDLGHAAGGQAWAPDFRDLDAAALARARALDLPVTAWTVNAPADIARMLRIGVDGIISDYPDRVREAAGR